MILEYSNNATSLLSSAVTSSATTIQLVTGGGAAFPALTTGDAFYVTIMDAATQLIKEIVLCTARSGDTLTVTRGQQGTAALNWASSSIVAQLLTAGDLNNLVASFSPGNLAGTSTFNASSTLTLAQVGKQIIFYGSTASQTLTLPRLSTATVGQGYWFVNTATVAVTLAAYSGDLLSLNVPGTATTTAATVALQPGDSAFFVDTGSTWQEQQGSRASSLSQAYTGYRGSISYTTTATQTSSDFGNMILIEGASTYTLTLPSLTGVPPGAVLAYSSFASVPVTLQTQGGVNLQGAGIAGRTSYTVSPGQAIVFVWDGSSLDVISATGIGQGQSWQNVTGSRGIGTSYPNNTGRPILVSIYSTGTGASQYLNAYVNGVLIGVTAGDTTNGQSSSTLTFIVPTGISYSTSGTRTLSNWAELR